MHYPILIVDDEPQIRRLIGLLLSEQGLTVLEASDGVSALRTVREASGKISLLLTDVHMDKMDGIQLAREVNHTFPSIPIICMSAIPADMLGRELTDIAFIQKPFSPAVLTTAIHRALAGGVPGSTGASASPHGVCDAEARKEGLCGPNGLFLY